MNKSIRNGLIVGVVVLIIIIIYSFLTTKNEENKKDEWVTIESRNNIQRVSFKNRNDSFSVNGNWQTSFGSDKSDIKFYSDKSETDVSEGIKKGCVLQYFARNEVSNIDDFKNKLLGEEKLFSYEDDNYQSNFSIIKINHNDVLVYDLKTGRWGESRTIYFFSIDQVYSFSMSYGTDEKEKCYSELDKTIKSFVY